MKSTTAPPKKHAGRFLTLRRPSAHSLFIQQRCSCIPLLPTRATREHANGGKQHFALPPQRARGPPAGTPSFQHTLWAFNTRHSQRTR